MKEQWIRWEPLKELSPKYFIVSVLNNCNGFKIILGDNRDDTKKDIHITFANGIHSYRSTYEGFRLRTMNLLSIHYDKNFYFDWTFFKVVNSKYVQWLVDESYSINKPLQYIHFSFVTSISILDVISPLEPLVEFVDQPNLDK